MIGYFIKRLLQFIPVLFLVSYLAFYISVHSPGDPVEIISQSANAQGVDASFTANRQYKDSLRKQLGLDLPLFYFSLGTQSDCDTIHRISDKEERYAFYRLSRKFGNWQNTAIYLKSINTLIDSMSHGNSTDNSANEIELFKTWAQVYLISTGLKKIYQPDIIKAKIDTLLNISKKFTALSLQHKHIIQIRKNFQHMKENSSATNNYLPGFSWNGATNQYHLWLSNLMKGDFGYSYTDNRPVADKIWQKFTRSFTLIFLAVFLAYLISIPIGLYSAKHRNRFPDKFFSLVVFILYSIPSFFFATMLLYFFSNPEYFYWFPESGYCDPETYNQEWYFFQKIWNTFPYMVLPILTYAYTSFAFLSRIVRGASLEIMTMDFVRTAKAKGLSEKTIWWKHIFRNASLPVITTFVTVFPAAVGGSVIVESIFSYDGMGIATYESIGNKDVPMIVAIFTLAGFMSMIAYFIGDILYALADPRITYKTRK